MRRKNLILYSLLSGTMTASIFAQVTKEKAFEKEDNVLPGLKVLPAGSILSGVKIPRYNKDYSPASMLEAKQLTIISKRHIQGSSVKLNFYDEAGKIKAYTHLKSVDYDQTTGLITSKETFTFSANQFKTTSQGLMLDWKNNRGFFLGKNHTIIYIKESVSMNDKKNTGNNITTKALSAVAAATMVITPNALSAMTAEDVAKMDLLSKPSTQIIENTNIQVALQVGIADQASKEIDRNKANLEKTIKQSETKTLNGKVPIAPFKIPMDLKPEEGKDHFSIKSEGNMFFDANKGIMVFSKNVKVTHPQYNFNCAGEVKLILAEKKTNKKTDKNKPNKEKKKPLINKQQDTLKPSDKFGDIKQIIATDNVSIVGRDKDGNPIAAKAGSLIYEHTSGVIILRGLNSRITMPDKQLKIIEENGYIKIDRNWNISGKGTQIDLNIERLKNNAK